MCVLSSELSSFVLLFMFFLQTCSFSYLSLFSLSSFVALFHNTGKVLLLHVLFLASDGQQPRKRSCLSKTSDPCCLSSIHAQPEKLTVGKPSMIRRTWQSLPDLLAICGTFTWIYQYMRVFPFFLSYCSF